MPVQTVERVDNSLMAIDPGLANTGIVVMRGDTIIEARTFRTKGNGHKTDFGEACRRSFVQTERIEDAIEEHQPGVIVVELYRDIPGALRKASNRWTTPLMLGVLLGAIARDHCVVVQDPEVVMRQYRPALLRWAAGQSMNVDGEALLTTEHERSAAAHALFYRDHAKLGLSRSTEVKWT